MLKYLIRLLSIAVFSFVTLIVVGQQFGGNPSAIKWNQVNTDTARIIFPVGMEESGRRVASIIHELQKNNATLGKRLRKINIVLQNQGTVSNAYVGLGPYRSEFYLFTPQNSFQLGSLNWVDNLALHEYRHVQQYNNFNVGLSKVASILFGQQGQALANAAAVPDWFFEGDAVFNETSLSKQGRGRLPEFFNGYQSYFRQKKHYSYMKLRNGSLKHFVPNHYELGYLLVSYGRQQYGADFWYKVTQDAARFKPLIYTWQGAIKKHAGIAYNKFVKDAFDYYQQKWQKNDSTSLAYLTSVKNYALDYKYPYLDSSGSIIVLKTGKRFIPTIYRIDQDGKEEKIVTRGIANDDYFSFNNDKVVFASFRADKRWGYREYSDIKVVDIASLQTSTITSKGRYFSPDISHDGQKVVAVNMQVNQASNLAVLDLDGKLLFTSKTTRGVVYTYPKFSADDHYLYAVLRNQDGLMSLVKIDLASGRETTVLAYANRVIGFPLVQNDTLFFSCSFNGSDEVWAYVEGKEKVYRVASHQTGLYQAFYDGSNRRLITSNFTADGYRLATIKSPQLKWQPVDEKVNAMPDLYVPLALQQEHSNMLENVKDRPFAVSKYKKAFNLLNFHSWRPTYDDPEISFSLLGENVLNTLQSELSYTYNRNESSHRAGLNMVYGGWYIQPLVGVSNTWSRNVKVDANTSYFYDELNLNAGIRLPINLTAGNEYRFLNLQATVNNQQVKWKGLSKDLFNNLSFNYWEARLQYSSQIQKAEQHIFPHWAQTLLVQHRNIINQYTGHQTLFSGYLYLPGFLRTHSIVLTAAFQMRDTMNQYSFSNNFPFSRGYPGLNYPRMSRLGVNYHSTLMYPDFGIANLVYFKRLRSNLFYDYSTIKSLRSGNTFSFGTTGAELFFDTKWWNQQDVSFGIRYSYLLDNRILGISNPHQWEIILPIGLF